MPARPNNIDPSIRIGTVIANEHPCREHFEVTVSFDSFPDAAPGQFLQVLCSEPQRDFEPSAESEPRDPRAGVLPDAGCPEPMLRRPFSIGGLRRARAGCEIALIGRVVGPGTAWLDRLRAGDEVDVLGPLGRPFTQPDADRVALLVAGGVGLPPIRWLGEVLAQKGLVCRVFYGVQTRDLLPLTVVDTPDPGGAPTACLDAFARCDIPAAVSTDDGSLGFHGRVTDMLHRYIETTKDAARCVCYGCGPEPMLEALAALCAQRDIPCELALERVMGCGLATCQSCVVPVRNGGTPDGWRYALCCTEGPVFDARHVLFEAP